MKRGDVVLVRFPHPSGQRGKKRPAVVVQSDTYADTVAQVLGSLSPSLLQKFNDSLKVGLGLS
jgi:hypothetical protein